MRDILKKLDGAPGVLGALVMTNDGVLVAAVPEADSHDRIAAFSSMLLNSIEKDSETLGFLPIKRITFWAQKGRLIIVPMGDFALVVIADRDSDLGFALMEVAGLARSLLKRSKIEV